MKNVRLTLLLLFYFYFVLGLLLVAAFETSFFEPGLVENPSDQFMFGFTLFVELLTIAVIPLSLRLFRFQKIDAELQTLHEFALRKWGILRIMLLGNALILNLLAYYILLNTSFGYLAIIVALCLPFIYPSKRRCYAETHLEYDDI